MGDEVTCAVRRGDRRSECKTLLETREIVVRGAERFTIPFERITTVTAARGELRVTWGGETAVFELGPRAARWAEKIRKPKSVIEKLGIKPAMRVGVVGTLAPGFLDELTACGAAVTAVSKPRGRATPAAYAVLFLACEARTDLAQLETARRMIESHGAIWVIRPKGSDAIHERDVLAAGRGAGLVDVKVVAFSATHSAAKFVIPAAER